MPDPLPPGAPTGDQQDAGEGERVELVRMALAEAGWPDAAVTTTPDGYPAIVEGTAPLDAFWKANAVVGSFGACWPCFKSWYVDENEDDETDECIHDPIASPWPPAPGLGSLEAGREEPT